MLAPRPQRRAPPVTNQDGHIPAPTGGLNTLAAASAMPDGQCPILINMVGGEYGLRARLGEQEWVTGLGGLPVRSMLAYKGSAQSGANDRLFAVTAEGIWDVTSSTDSPSLEATFSAATDDSGYGVAHAIVTSGGHFLLYCDEEYGYYVYAETGDTWTRVVATATNAWQNTHGYTAGDYVLNDSGKTYVCTQSGTSAGSGGPTGTGTGITDGTCTWDYVQAVLSGVSPANLVHVTVHKNRVWFTERGSGRAWYLALASIFGTATSFNFGAQFRSGGHLVGLWKWTLDGGAGIDDHLAAIGGGGDVVVYAGTDPSSSSTWAIKGVWPAGALPVGRRIASEDGGDVLIACARGVVPLSRIVSGGAQDPNSYVTRNISNLFNYYFGMYRLNRGWSIRRNPEDNSLLVLIPTTDEQSTIQLALAEGTGGWSIYRDLEMTSAEAWDGKLYFGTPDGSVKVNTGYVDGVTLADPNSFTAIQWSLVTKFHNLGNGRKKRVTDIRPHITTQTAAPSYTVKARYDFDLSEVSAVTDTSTSAGDLWDTAEWDSAVWSGDYAPSHQVRGAIGCGTHVAIAIRGTATGRTVLVGFDVAFNQGGFR